MVRILTVRHGGTLLWEPGLVLDYCPEPIRRAVRPPARFRLLFGYQDGGGGSSGLIGPRSRSVNDFRQSAHS